MFRTSASVTTQLLHFTPIHVVVKRLRFDNLYPCISVIGKIRQQNVALSTSSDNTGSYDFGKGDDTELKNRIFSTVLFEKDPDATFMRRKIAETKFKNLKLRENLTQGTPTPLPLSLKLLETCSEVDVPENEMPQMTEDLPPHYPFAEKTQENLKLDNALNYSNKARRQEYHTKLLQSHKEIESRMKKWMSDYDMYDENPAEYCVSTDGVNYGTANPREPVSKVPCGGCGALLHCQDHSIPGYLPKELFAKRKNKELQSMICQRCHFLKEFNIALDVCVTPEDYPKIISCIQNKRAIVVLMVDLLDFPCSIWPGILNIIGSKRPVIVVGNKIDLIPGDQPGYLNHVKLTLQKYLEKMGISEANIKHIALISAQTGFGVEDLITELHGLWEYKSDVFLLGCTNVGKSTLFNMFLQSDFCKTLASDLVQRATTSEWPGTTLNLLKFPIMRPEGWKLALRMKRLKSQTKTHCQEKMLLKDQLQRKRMYHMPSLLQYVGKTFPKEDRDDFHSLPKGDSEQVGIDDNHADFIKGRWCFDTPGVMHPDQILNLLTTEEITKVIPKTPIIPRFFMLKPGRSLFLAGLGRIDSLSSSGDESPRVAVFSSSSLPVTIVQTEEAEDVHKKLLGSELTAVPCGSSQRLADWPGLQAKHEVITVQGIGWRECCADIVLSSAGWVAISGRKNSEMSFRVWTPLARGIHLRQPALLPFSVNFRGKRIDHTPTYHPGRADGRSCY